VAGVLPATSTRGGLLGQFEQRRPRVAGFLDNNSMALMQFGMGLLSGGNRGEAWSNASQGLAYGSQADQARRQRTQEEEERARQEEALGALLMSEEFASLPEAYRTMLTSDPELAREFIASDLARRTTPAAPRAPIEVEGQLVDPVTFEVIGDYRRPEAPDEPDAPDTRVIEGPDGRPHLYAFNPATGAYDIDQGVASSAAQRIINETPADETLRKGLQTGEAETWTTLVQAGNQAATLQADLSLLTELSAIAPEGPLAGRLAQAFPGFSTAGDAFQSVVLRVAPSLRVPGSGATSDIEYQGMLNSLPTLVQQRESRDIIIAMMQAKAQIDMDRAAVIQQYQSREITDVQARAQLAEINSRSILTPQMRALLGGGGAPRVNPPAPAPAIGAPAAAPAGAVEWAPGILFVPGP